MSKHAALVRADALHIPLRSESVDLIVTSPPYFALRSYQDGGEHYDGQIGSEETPQAFLEALWAVTAECARVLKPSGSMFVNLGDKYSGAGGGPGSDDVRAGRPLRDAAATWRSVNPANSGIPTKSLMLLPERYRVGCVDQLGLTARAVLVWSKPNGLPESARDRVHRRHEDWVHFTRQRDYFSGVDEIREPHDPHTLYCADWEAAQGGYERERRNPNRVDGGNNTSAAAPHPLGKMPGSVWTIATEPLRVPAELDVDHFAAFPTEWPRRLILGWSPSGICTACGEGRRPFVDRSGVLGGDNNPESRNGVRRRSTLDGGSAEWAKRMEQPDTITGYVCACDVPIAPTRPAVVLDPFAGTGTTVMVARALGRMGVGLDLSADYLRLATWRVFESGHARKAIARTHRERQGSLDLLADATTEEVPA